MADKWIWNEGTSSNMLFFYCDDWCIDNQSVLEADWDWEISPLPKNWLVLCCG